MPVVNYNWKQKMFGSPAVFSSSLPTETSCLCQASQSKIWTQLMYKQPLEAYKLKCSAVVLPIVNECFSTAGGLLKFPKFPWLHKVLTAIKL